MHDNSLNERGVTTSIEAYGQILSSLGWTVEIAYEASNRENIPEVVERIGNQFQLRPYEEFSQLEKTQKDYDAAYFQKSGAQDGKVFNITPTLIHTVFQEYDPHGRSYVYISKWLAQKMKSQRFNTRYLLKGVRARMLGCSNAREFDFVPLASNVERQKPLRDGSYGLTDGNFVILRYGGLDSFDLPWVQRELIEFVNEHLNVVALMVNTQPFCKHDRIRFLPRFTSTQERDHLLATSDLCIHARARGESFGLYVVEVMQAGRPLISYSGGIDSHHVDLLSGTGALFSNPLQLREKLKSMYLGIEVVDCEELIERAENFRNDCIAPRLNNLIQKLS